jgi:hypothetical protein
MNTPKAATVGADLQQDRVVARKLAEEKARAHAGEGASGCGEAIVRYDAGVVVD